MENTIEIPEGYEARIEGNKVILEPKESEDEKIRCAMLRGFNSMLANQPVETFYGESIRDIIAYLERQKEQPTDAKLERVVKAARRVLNNWLDGTDCPDVSGDFAELEYAIREYDGEEKQKEQKPIQDREEREYVRTLKSLIADFLRGKDEIDRGYYQKIYDWLDGRHIEQKPAEWSEEDDALLKEIVSFFKDGTTKLQHDLDLYAGFLENKLKSLHPQPHWKPSEEQMLALGGVLDYLDESDNEDADIIRELINDLKKLKYEIHWRRQTDCRDRKEKENSCF